MPFKKFYDTLTSVDASRNSQLKYAGFKAMARPILKKISLQGHHVLQFFFGNNQ